MLFIGNLNDVNPLCAMAIRPAPRRNSTVGAPSSPTGIAITPGYGAEPGRVDDSAIHSLTDIGDTFAAIALSGLRP
jgi:hypothetical protein